MNLKERGKSGRDPWVGTRKVLEFKGEFGDKPELGIFVHQKLC